MKSNKKLAVCGLAGIVLAMLAGAALAQQAPHPPAAKPTPGAGPTASTETPQQTTATYADWVVQCQTQTGPPPQKNCDMAQIAQVQGKNTPFSRVAILHPTAGQPVRLMVQVPINASFATGVLIQTGDDDPGLTAPFARCVPAGCFADFDIREDALKKFRAASGVGKLSFADAGAHTVTVPLSFNGFGQAFDVLAKE
jgi:invasion protein IalB